MNKKLYLLMICIVLLLSTTQNIVYCSMLPSEVLEDIELPEPEPVQEEDCSNKPPVEPELTEEQLTAKFKTILEGIIQNRNDIILKGDEEALKGLYNLDIKLSLYAYEHEAIKLKYLINWAEKQGVQFDDIDSEIKMRKVRDRENGLYGMTCNVSTAYTYSYIDTPDEKNTFKLGTSHYIHLQKDENEDNYLIVKEWYTDPFSDSLDLENIKSEEMKEFILSKQAPDYTPDERTQRAINYAHQYSGIGEGEYLFKYNKNYIDCNSRGGDCANFASQILFEGAGFKKTSKWNYNGDGTKAWLNAQAFKNYMIHSGRGSYIQKGSYKDVYKTAYQMRPGDFVAYEKKGRITHISTVTGLDSKGYPLVTCHNTDRLLVPYDLGWSNKNITFHLIDMHY